MAGCGYGSVLIKNVQLLGTCVLLQQLTGDFSFRREHDSILGQDAQSCTGVRDSLERVFDLVQTALGRKDSGLFGAISCVLSLWGGDSRYAPLNRSGGTLWR